MDEPAAGDVTRYDTADGVLAGAGLRLERTVEGTRGRWRLELPAHAGGGSIERAGGPTVPGPIKSALTAALAGGRVLEPDPPKPSRRGGNPLAAALRAQHSEILAHDVALRLGGGDEDVHQLRVAMRRARAYLRAARPLLDAERTEPLREELGWAGGALGAPRDADVLVDRLSADAAGLDDADRTAFSPLPSASPGTGRRSAPGSSGRSPIRATSPPWSSSRTSPRCSRPARAGAAGEARARPGEQARTGRGARAGLGRRGAALAPHPDEARPLRVGADPLKRAPVRAARTGGAGHPRHTPGRRGRGGAAPPASARRRLARGRARRGPARRDPARPPRSCPPGAAGCVEKLRQSADAVAG